MENNEANDEDSVRELELTNVADCRGRLVSDVAIKARMRVDKKRFVYRGQCALDRKFIKLHSRN